MNGVKSLFESDLLSALGGIDTSDVSMPKAASPLNRLLSGVSKDYLDMAKQIVSLPVSYDTILKLLLTSAKPGEASALFDRSVMVVPAGMTMTMTDVVPEGKQESMVYLHRMLVTPSSSEVLVTHHVDNQPPLLYQVPANYPISVEASFLPTVRTQMTHTVENNDTVDVTFTHEMQLVAMSHELYSGFFLPLMQGQIEALKAVVSSLGYYGSVG